MKDRKRNRLKDYDYSQGGCYFVTICTKDRMNHFGEIVNGEMILNPAGNIAYKMWVGLENICDNIALDAFVIMPNHIHGIVIITDDNVKKKFVPVGDASAVKIINEDFSTRNEENPKAGINREMRPLQENDIKYDRTKMILSKIIQAYKAETTRRIKRISNINSIWQRSFYDHIIRGERDFFNIQGYIQNNPMQWEWDEENILCLKKAPGTVAAVPY